MGIFWLSREGQTSVVEDGLCSVDGVRRFGIELWRCLIAHSARKSLLRRAKESFKAGAGRGGDSSA